jgi:hypothetical protein
MTETAELAVLAETAAMETAENEQTTEIETPVEPTPVAVGGLLEVEVKRWHGTADARVFGWRRMPVREALRLQDDTFRCPECLGRVRLRRASAEKGYGDHAEHYSKNTGCSLGNCFGGEKQQHVKPIS